MKTFAVYKIHCIITNKDYIGISDNPIGRINAHENSPYPIGRVIRKYGWENFEIDILHLVKTREEVCKLEIKEIIKHNCQVPNGYNLTSGGDNPPNQKGKKRKPRSKEYCKKLSKSLQGIQNVKGKHWKLSEKTKEKMRGNQNGKGNKGKKHSKQTRIKKNITQLRNSILKLEEELEN